MAIGVNPVRVAFSDQGYVRTHETAKLDEYQAPTTGQYLYIYKKPEGLKFPLQVIIHPDLRFEPFLDLPGVTCQKPDQFRHGSNMRQFPKRKNRGANEIEYGRALEIDSKEALERFLQFFDTPAGSEREGADMPPRLKAIELENFKGVGKRIRIELAPVTLLFGANSAGKSTILQAMQYVREILERRNANPDRTLYGGDFVDLGGFRNLVHQRDLSRRISIKLELELNRASLPDLVPEPWEEWQAGQTFDEQGIWDFHTLVQETRDRTETVSIQLDVGWSDAKQAAVVVGYEAGVNGEWLARVTASEDGRDVAIRLNKDNPIFLRYTTQEDLDILGDLEGWIDRGDLEEVSESETTISISDASFLRNTTQDDIENVADSEDRVDPADLDIPAFLRSSPEEDSSILGDWRDWVGTGDLEDASTSETTVPASDAPESQHAYSVLGTMLFTVQEAGMERPGQGLRQWLTGFDSALPHLGQLLAIPGTSKGGSANIYITREFTAFLSSMVVGPGMLIREQLRKLRYLGPIRNFPQRDFVAALTPDEARWADGTAAWESLLTGDASLVDQVSKWMADKDKLATGYELERRAFKEVDVGTLNWLLRAVDPDAGVRSEPRLLRELATTPEKLRLDLIEADTGMRVQPRDVGIGISQVLPVVVAALDPSASLVAIEQPELHIHPAVQVGLGDLLVKGAKENGTCFLIETHSEHLILRLLRRIRETTDGELPPGAHALRPEDVSVWYVQPDGAGVELVPLPIDETGEFTTRWPKGFFDERAEELF